MSKGEYLRIVPPPQRESGANLTHGTKVFTESGQEITGITKIVLTANMNDLWRADISCIVRPPEVTCLSDIDRKYIASRWQRFLAWLRFGPLRAQ